MHTVRTRRLCTALAVLALTVAPSAQAIVAVGASSSFDTDADGWTFVDVPGGGNYVNVLAGFPAAVVYAGIGGNPDGFISAKDPSDQTFFFSAPSKFLGNQSLLYGGTLSYDIKVDPASPPWTGDPDVVLTSAAGVLVYDFGQSAANNPGASFSTRTIPWTEAGWRVGSINGGAVTQQQFQQVIASLDRLLIAGEFVASTIGVPSTFETASLDNVTLAPVPEPAEALLMALGLAGVVLAARRRASHAARQR